MLPSSSLSELESQKSWGWKILWEVIWSVLFWSLDHLCGPSLDSLHYVPVSLLLRTPELDTVHFMRKPYFQWKATTKYICQTMNSIHINWLDEYGWHTQSKYLLGGSESTSFSFNQHYIKGNGKMGLLSDKRRLPGRGLHFQRSVYSSAFVSSFQNLPEVVDLTRFQGRSVPSKQMHLRIWACYLPFWHPLCTKIYSLTTPH